MTCTKSIIDQQITEEIIENNDQSLFTTIEKTPETNPVINNNNSILNYDDCIEDISIDGIDPPPPPPSTSTSNAFEHFSVLT